MDTVHFLQPIDLPVTGMSNSTTRAEGSSSSRIGNWEAFPEERRECRICHEEDNIQNLESPCACNGTMKLVHRRCLEQWRSERLESTCEICNQPYRVRFSDPSPPQTLPPPEISIDMSGENLDTALIAADIVSEQIFDGGYDECATTRGAWSACIRVSVLLPLAFMILKHCFDTVDMDDDSFSNVFMIFSLRVVAFGAPIYVLAWLIHLWIRRRERLEAARTRAEIRVTVSSGPRRRREGIAAALAPPSAGSDSHQHRM